MLMTGNRILSGQSSYSASPDQTTDSQPSLLRDRSKDSPQAAHNRSSDETAHDITSAGHQEYLPRSQLSQGPTPLTPVLLTYPDDAPPGVFRSTLMLFIDELGHVRSIRMTGDPLPRRLEEVVRQAFASTRFSPGLQQDLAVKSRIEIEVEFAQDIPPAGRSAL